MKIIKYITVLASSIVLILLLLNLFLNKEVYEETQPLPVELPSGYKGPNNGNTTVIPTTVGVDPAVTTPFRDILTEAPSKEFNEMLSVVHEDVYAIFPCDVDRGQTKVVMFTAKYTKTQEGNSFQPSVEVIEAWEPYVFRDVGSLIYPSLPVVTQEVSFFDVPGTELKKAVAQVGEQELPIYAGWRLNYVMYGSSVICVLDAMDMVYAGD